MPSKKETVFLSTQDDKRRYLRRFRKNAGAAPKLDFLFGIYSIHQIQSGRSGVSNFFNDIPPSYQTTDRHSDHYLHPWYLETLANELLVTPWKPKLRDGAVRTLNPTSFSALVQLYRCLYKAESASDGPSLKRANVLIQMGRLTKRQFEWQRKIATTSRLNLYHSIYRTYSSKKFFLEKFGIDFDTAMNSCIAIYAKLLQNHEISYDIDVAAIGLKTAYIAKTIDIISLPLNSACEQATDLRNGFDHIGYAPSLFRRFPLIRFERGGRRYAMCPLPDLIFFRMTEGLFYDFIDAPANIRNEFAINLENHVRELLRGNGILDILGDISYGKTSERTPDILISDGSSILAAIEVKGRRQSASVRFSENPIQDSPSSFDDLSKGVFQLWKYQSDCNSKLIPPSHSTTADIPLGICTLDNWIEVGRGVEEGIYRMAERRADSAPREIPAVLRKPVSFFTISDLDFILPRSDVATFIEIIRLSLTPEFRGWLLSSIFAHKYPGREKVRATEPIEAVVPWWGTLNHTPHNPTQNGSELG